MVRSVFAMPFLAGAVALVASAAPGEVAEPGIRQSFHLDVPVPPAPVPVGDATQLAYELHLTNFARDTLTVRSVQVIEAASGRRIAEFYGSQLAALLGHPGARQAAAQPLAVAPGGRAVVYLNLSPQADIPRALRHRVAFEVMADDGQLRAAVEGGAVEIDDSALPELGPPLHGGPWVAVYHPAWARGHRRVLYAIEGRARIPGRWAVDWMKADPTGGAAGDAAARHGLGAAALAVADARVVAIRDDMAAPGNCAERVPLALQDEAGNYVVLELGDGRYAFYEHLQPGVRVKPGETVRRGQVIGALGCTGSATRPHLHFHVGDGVSPLAVEGLPWILSDAEVTGVYGSMDDFRAGEAWRQPVPENGDLRDALPVPLSVVLFPEQSAQ